MKYVNPYLVYFTGLFTGTFGVSAWAKDFVVDTLWNAILTAIFWVSLILMVSSLWSW